jgi:hypothetical protein
MASSAIWAEFTSRFISCVNLVRYRFILRRNFGTETLQVEVTLSVSFFPPSHFEGVLENDLVIRFG